MVGSSLLIVLALSQDEGSAFTREWLLRLIRPDFSAQSGLPPALALLATNLFLWQRAASATSRELSFFSVGVSFRAGLLLLMVTGTLYTGLGGENLVPLLWIFLGFGLTAVAIARVQEKAEDAKSIGRPLAPQRFVQLMLAVLGTLGVAALLSRGYAPEKVWAFLFVTLAPVWHVVRVAGLFVLRGLSVILEPLMTWLIEWLRNIFALGWTELLPQSPVGGTEQPEASAPSATAQAVAHVLSQIGSVVVVVVVVAIVIRLLLFFLDKSKKRNLRDGDEEATPEDISFGGNILERGVRALKDMAALMRRFGMTQQLLAAVSVQNIYANLCRIARHRGYARRLAQPPDDYLPTLQRAFGGQDEALQRITNAYMRVHYGEHPITMAELAQLRADYQRVRDAEAAVENSVPHAPAA